MFHYTGMFIAEFVTLAGLKVPSGNKQQNHSSGSSLSFRSLSLPQSAAQEMASMVKVMLNPRFWKFASAMAAPLASKASERKFSSKGVRVAAE